MVEDSYGNYMQFTYLTMANDANEAQQGIAYLAYIDVYKKDPTIIATTNQMVKVAYIEFEYMYGNLISIGEYKETPQGKHTYFSYHDDGHISKIHKDSNGYTFIYDNRNRVTKAEVYSTRFTNGDYLEFIYNKNGKKTIIKNSLGELNSYTFDDYYHTNSVENMNGYTTFYQYEDIYFNDVANVILSPNYNKNHNVIVQSNRFKNVANPIVNHGFEVEIGNNIYGWTKDVTSGSSATIENNIYLFGSKVLKLYKSPTGRAQVYQDIDVISGKQYIIQGYIKNTNNNGTGAYIDVIGLNGEVTTTSQSAKIKNSKDFYRYEYKFTSSYTGKARICLMNDSTGHAYFDHIQINTNYLDTRYNYLENSSFESENIGGWSGYNYIVTAKDKDIFPENCGDKVLKLATNGYVHQMIYSPGLAGDTFVFGGYCFYENYTGKVSIKLSFVDENESHSKQFIFDGNDINAIYKMSKFSAPCDYIAVEIEIHNLSDSSYANVDNFAIYKEGYGLHLMYSDEGYLEEEYDETQDIKTKYEYDESGNLIKVITNKDVSNGNAKEDVTDITYNKEAINTIKNKNITSTFETDSDGNITKTTASTTNTSIQQYYGSTTYTADGLYPVTSKDVFGNLTTSTYDYLTGLITKVVDSDNKFTEYTYDAEGNVLKLINGKWNNKKIVTYTYDIFGNLSTITTGGLTYTFIYNNYGDLKSVSVGDEVIMTNDYLNENHSTAVYTGKLNHTSYNYGTVYFEYDEENRIKNIYYQSLNGIKEKVLKYMYNDSNEVALYIDLKENVTYYYNYDYQNRLINVNATNGNTITYSYDNESNLVSKTNINGANTYTYGDVSLKDEENKKIIGENIADRWNISYEYSNDSFAQLEIISYYMVTTSIDKNYTYETAILDGTTYYTGRIKELEYLDGNNQIIKYVYTYDKNNNITNIVGYKNGSIVYQEENNYDIFNQITMQYIMMDDKEFGSEYFYDTRGNIVAYYVVDIHTNQYMHNYQFTYQATGNKDKLYKIESLIDNQTHYVEYASTGEPNLYFGWTIGYDMRSITTLMNTEYQINYSYNANGLRIGKTVAINNSTTNIVYTLDGNNIIKEVRSGTTNEILQYFYDSSDNILGFTYNNEKYLYLKNLQNDIIGIVDSNNYIVVKYYYDAYGRVIYTIDTSNCSLSTINPFRYRSYYQDNETGWYYLNSRFYNPLACRFVTMDSQLNLSLGYLGLNLFGYAINNPINHIEINGQKPYQLFSTADAAAIDFAKCYNEKSITENAEYGTSICRKLVAKISYQYVKTVKNFIFFKITTYVVVPITYTAFAYYYLSPIKGGKDSVFPMPSLYMISNIHTHGAYDPSYGSGNDNFSTGKNSDIYWADKFKMTIYMVNPKGEVKKYNPFSKATSIIATDIFFDRNHPAR